MESVMKRKEKMKGMVRRAVVAVTATAIVMGSVASPAAVKAKGTKFINKKSASVTPIVKSEKRANGSVKVTVSIPKAKVKKLGKVTSSKSNARYMICCNDCDWHMNTQKESKLKRLSS